MIIDDLAGITVANAGSVFTGRGAIPVQVARIDGQHHVIGDVRRDPLELQLLRGPSKLVPGQHARQPLLRVVQPTVLQGGDLGLAQTTAGQDAKERFCRQLHDGSSEVIRQVVTPADQASFPFGAVFGI